MSLSQKCIDDTMILQIRPRMEKWMVELYSERMELEMDKYKEMTTDELQKVMLDFYTDENMFIDIDVKQEILNTTHKEDFIGMVYEELLDKWSEHHQPFDDWCVDLFIWD